MVLRALVRFSARGCRSGAAALVAAVSLSGRAGRVAGHCTASGAVPVAGRMVAVRVGILAAAIRAYPNDSG